MSWGLTEEDIRGDVAITKASDASMPPTLEALLAGNPDLSVTERQKRPAIERKPRKQQESLPQPKQEDCKITLPYPPSANRYWRTYNNRVVVSAEARAYKKQVAESWIWNGDPVAGEVSVTLKVFRPRRSGDLDNRIKTLLDSLNGIAYNDDSQVVELHAYRFDDKHAPRVEVEIKQVQND